jgi:hypothetical protein
VRRLHQSVVLACLITGEAGGKLRKEIRRYGTTTRELKLLREWLLSMGCRHVPMESRRLRELTHLCLPLLTLEVRKREFGGGGSSTESIGGSRASRSDRHESDAAMRGGLPVDPRG